MSTNVLDTGIEFLKGVGPKKAQTLNTEAGIFTFRDLLHYYPYRYIDRTQFHQVNKLMPEDEYIQLKGELVSMRQEGAGRKKRLKAQFQDESGIIELIWFQSVKWIADALKLNTTYILYGKLNFFRNKFSVPHPELEEFDPNAPLPARLQSLYSSTDRMKKSGLDTKGLSKLILALTDHMDIRKVKENLSQDVLNEYKLTGRGEALFNIHFPKNEKEHQAARYRLKFEELFFVQLKLAKLQVDRKAKYRGPEFTNINGYFNEFYHEHLPFELTGAQKRVVKEVRQDVVSGTQMNRLLQGDVGSGKTMVSLLCMLMALDNGYQAAMMAPTEILAQQHYKYVSEMLEPLGIKVGILTGSVKGADRRAVLTALEQGYLNIIVGTHALLEDKVKFQKLGIAVIDEQHRFGVAQRARLWSKGVEFVPHVLVMTATPIPRTLAMTLYGDLEVSVIDELPPGRKLIKTVHRTDGHRLKVFGFIKEQIAEGRQVYIVYPLIEESEKMDYKDLMDGYESIVRSFPTPQYQVSIVHGRMKPEDKDHEMMRFKRGETHIMVATTVIEVGVDVPNASLMIIESSERFGLTQMHQLRGRVGRGADQSYCILMTGHKVSNEGKERIQTMVRTNDGFEIAEVDLRMRGPGDITGTQQSGVLDLRIANLATDAPILGISRDAVRSMLVKDSKLEHESNSMVKSYFNQWIAKSTDWTRIS